MPEHLRARPSIGARASCGRLRHVVRIAGGHQVVISKERGFDYTYQLLIDDYPIQLMSKEDDAVETPRGLMPRSPRVSPSPRVGEAPAAQSPLGSARKAVQRSLSFGKRDSAAKRATAEMVACCHLVALDKAQGPVGITLANSETQLADSKRKVGVVVHAVEPLGSAAAAGLMVGDVIMAVNGKTVSNHWEAIAAVDHDSHVEFKVRPARAPPLPRATCVLHVAPPTGELLCPYAAPAAAPRT